VQSTSPVPHGNWPPFSGQCRRSRPVRASRQPRVPDVYPARDSTRSPTSPQATSGFRTRGPPDRRHLRAGKVGDVERARYNQDESRTYPGIRCVAQPALRPVSISYRTSMVFGVACPQRSSVQGLQGCRHIRANIDEPVLNVRPSVGVPCRASSAMKLARLISKREVPP